MSTRQDVLNTQLAQNGKDAEVENPGLGGAGLFALPFPSGG